MSALAKSDKIVPHLSQQDMQMKLVQSLFAVIVAGGAIAGATSHAQEGRKLLESRESLYNNIYVYGQGPYVSMTFGYNRRIYTESIYNSQDDRDLPVEYTRLMTASLMYAKSLNSILEIGFGGGRTAWYLHRFLPNVAVTSVELDPTVIELARKYFGIKNEPNFQVANRDGRIFLTESKDKYDIILIDAYRGPFVPFHLLTKEFYEIVKAHLAEGGVVAQNVEPTTMLFDSAVKTINAVFPEIDFYMADGNIVTVAYEGPPRTIDDLDRTARERNKAYGLRYSLHDMLDDRWRAQIDAGSVIDPHPPESAIDPHAKVLTDDFAPVEALKAIERHNRKWP
jgi:spermidine synthase